MTTGFVPHTAQAGGREHRTLVAWLWVIQFALAALYLATGTMKWVMPLDQLAQMTQLPGLFMRGVATLEIMGALGLILPGLYGVARWLTPVAAMGLFAIMVAATVSVIVHGPGPAALLSAGAGLLDLFVAIRRWRLLTE